MYMKAESLLYNIERTQIPMHSGVIEVNYVEMVDESNVEFSHTHVDYEVYYCVEGSLQIKMEGFEHILLPGQYALLSPGTVHEVRYDPHIPKKYFIFIFQLSQFHKRPVESESVFFDAFAELFQEASFFVGADRNNAAPLIEKMRQEHTDRLYGYKELMRGCYLEFIILILRNLIPNDGRQGIDNLNINMAIKITGYMHQNYNKNIALQDVADAMFVTPRHINRIFQDYFGSSFHKTLRTYRVNYAKNYLHDTDYSIEKIAELVGFSSAQQLVKMFLEVEGVSISEYRARHKASSPQESHDEEAES